MLKYTDVQVTFSEVPDEISLCINISNCPFRCPACHSKELGEDVGEPLTKNIINELVNTNPGITCICFMGGDSNIEELYDIFNYCFKFNNIHIAGYTGRESIPKNIPNIHYIKIGPYKEEFGPINSPNTNQRFYTKGSIMKKIDVSECMWYDTTNKFWKTESYKIENDTNI